MPYQIAGGGLLGIQGQAGTGKTTLGYDLAPLLGATVFETSNAFRGFTVLVQRLGISPLDRRRCEELAESDFDFAVQGRRVIVGGMDVTAELRSAATDAHVSKIASYPGVRHRYIQVMLSWVNLRPAIAIGRYIREVWPAAQLVLEVKRTDGVTEAARGDDAAALATRRSQDRRNAKVALVSTTDHYVTIDTTGLSRLQQRDLALAYAQDAGFRPV
jgi:cytidylate kinase